MIGLFLLALTQTPDAAALDRLRDSMRIRGAAIAVIRPDGSVWTGTFGESHPGVAITPETVFDVGSVGKMFTAAVIHALVAEGALDLDGPISRWLPEAPNAGSVSVRMLLTHTSGWADVWDDRGFVPRLVTAPTRRWTAADVLAATPAPVGTPGEAWDYSSSGYVALGTIAETASGRAFDALLRDHVLAPFGLTRTVHGAYAEPLGPLAHAWLDINRDGMPEDFTALLPPTSWRTAAGTAGAVLTTASDLATFTRRFVSRLPPSDWVERPDGNQHGLGVLRIELDSVTLIGHRGNAAGYSAAAWHAPEHNVTVVVLSNAHGIRVTPLVRQALAGLRNE